MNPNREKRAPAVSPNREELLTMELQPRLAAGRAPKGAVREF